MKGIYYFLGLHKPITQGWFNKMIVRILFILGLLPECGHFDTCMPIALKRHCVRTDYSYVSWIMPWAIPCWCCKYKLTFRRRLFLKP